MRPLPAVLFSLAAIASLVMLAAPAQAARPVRGSKLAPQIITLAKKWARVRDLPLDWILATILSESGGNPGAAGDSGVSVGLMQVNTRAHAAALAAAGVTRAALFAPDINIDWGTRILKAAHARVQAALAVRASAVPVDVLVRLAYTGVDAPAAILAGRDPRVNYMASATTWRQNLARAAALV